MISTACLFCVFGPTDFWKPQGRWGGPTPPAAGVHQLALDELGHAELRLHRLVERLHCGAGGGLRGRFSPTCAPAVAEGTPDTARRGGG